jgi:ssDNA-binding Zn-finger/Zn-ribbon topoisomerase 1
LFDVPPNDELDIGIEETLPVAPQEGPRFRTEEELNRDFPEQSRILKCADCQSPLVLREGRHGVFYGCEKYEETGCKGSHSCRQKDAKPYGIPGNAETRAARREVHDWFSKVRGGNYSDETYFWLSKELKISQEDCQIGKFDLARCKDAIRAIQFKLGEYTRAQRILERDIL